MSIAYGNGNPPPGRVNFGWIGESWNLFLAQAGIWVVAMLVYLAVPTALFGLFFGWVMLTMGPNAFAPSPQTLPPPGKPITSLHTLLGMPPQMTTILIGEIAIGLLILLYTAFLYGGLLRMAVRQVRGLPIRYPDIFSGGPLFGRMLGAMILLGLAGYGVEMLTEVPAFLLLWLRPKEIVAVILAFVFAFVLILCLFLILSALLLPAFALMADGVGVFDALRRSIRAMKAQWLPATGFVLVLGLLVYASEIPCGLGLLATIPMMFLVCALAYRDLAGMPDVLPPPAPAYGVPSPGVWPPPPGPVPLPQVENRE